MWSTLLNGLRSKGRLIALHANIILEWKCMAAKYSLAYYDMKLITTVKSFTVPIVVKLFMSVIYAYL
jgi:hypothetical protein